MERFKVKSILVLEYKKRNDHKIFHSIAKLMGSDSDIDGVFKSMHHSVMTKIKGYGTENWAVLDAIIKLGINIFEC